MTYYEKDATTVVLKFFGTIGMWWQGATDFTDTFQALEKKYQTIIIQAHCYGGYVTEGNVIFNAINSSKTNVIYEIVGVSASMSAIVQMACNKIVIAENGFVMVHRPRAGAEGNADDMFSTGKLLKSMEKNFTTVFTRRSGAKAKAADIAKWMDGADHWFDAEEALALGLVDEIIPAVVKDITSLTKPSTEQDAQNIFSRFTANLDADIPTHLLLTNHTEMKKLLIEAFALTTVTADSSDTAVMDAVRAKFADKDQTIQTMQAAAKIAAESQASVLITAQEKVMGKEFTPEQKASLQKIAKEASIDVLITALSFSTPAVSAAPAATDQPAAAASAPSAMNLIDNTKVGALGIPAERANWDWSQWCESDEKGLFALSNDAQNNIYKRTYGEDMPK